MNKTKETQHSLLSLLPSEHNISIEPIVPSLSLRPGLVKILLTKSQGTDVTRFLVPGQWTKQEAAYLLHEIRGITWQLNDEGIPIALWAIIEICEEFCQ